MGKLTTKTTFYKHYLVLLILLFSVFSKDALSQPLSPVYPKNNAYENSLSIPFQWNDLEDALSYEVLLSQDINFLSGVITSGSITESDWTSSGLTYGMWYWKVIGTTTLGVQESNVFSLTIYSPNLNPSLALWLKSDAGIVVDGSNNVISWTDQSSNGFVLSQADVNKMPLSSTSVLNGKPTVSFNGNDFLNGGDILDLQTFSRSVFVFGKMGPSDQTFYSKAAFDSYTSRFGLMKYGASEVYISHDATANHIFASSTSNSHNFYLVTSNRATSQNRYLRNGVQFGSGFLNSSYNFNSNFRFLLGAFSGNGGVGEQAFLTGEIQEMVMVNDVSASEISNIQSYLRYKYSPPVNLGKDTLAVNFCPVSLSVSSSFSSILWSTGSTLPNISVNQDVVVWVQVTDIFGFTSRDTILVKYPEIPGPENLGICLNQSNTWNADMGSGFTYSWSSGESTPSIAISTPGIYNVTVFDGFGCSKNSGDFTFSIDDYSETAYLGDDIDLCSGNFIALQIGASETINYSWPDGSSANQYAVDTTGNYFLESININGCVAQDTIYVTVVGIAPTADFAVNDVCDLSAAIFTDNSYTPDLSPVDEWLWTFGDGQQSTEQNPSHVFANGAGIYNVQLYVAQGGCGAFYSAPVEVFERPQAAFSMNGYCSNDPSFFVDESIEGSTAITGWLWNFGQPSSGLNNTSVQPSPMKQYGEVGSFIVTLQVTDANNCVDEEVQTIDIYTSPISAFTASDICAGASIAFTNSSSVPNPDFIQSYLWDFGDNTYSILPIPNKTFSNSGYHTIGLTVTSSNGCFTLSQEQILVHAIPVPAIAVGPSCVGTYTEFNDVSTVLTGVVESSSWSVDLGAAISGSPISYVFSTPGSHNVELTTISDFGCTKDTLVIIQVNPILNADFDVFPSVVIVGEPVEFINSSVGATSYEWSFGEGGVSTDSDPVYFYGSEWIDSTMTATLYVENNFGCKDTNNVDFPVRKARFDLEVNNVYLVEENGFYTVGVGLKNVGTALIEYTDVELRLSNGVILQERFEDTIFSGQTKIKVFTSKPSAFVSTEDGVDAWICAEGTPYSGLAQADEDWSNNEYCKNVEGTLPVLIGPNPNPASTAFEFSLLVSTESVLTIDLIDSRGRIVRSFFDATTVSPGLYTYTVSLQGVNSGVYFLRMSEEVKRVVVE